MSDPNTDESPDELYARRPERLNIVIHPLRSYRKTDGTGYEANQMVEVYYGGLPVWREYFDLDNRYLSVEDGETYSLATLVTNPRRPYVAVPATMDYSLRGSYGLGDWRIDRAAVVAAVATLRSYWGALPVCDRSRDFAELDSGWRDPGPISNPRHGIGDDIYRALAGG